MSFKDLTFKEKKTFYKERQKFFDAVTAAKNGEFPVITYNGERYKLFTVENDYQYADKEHYGYCVVFNKAFKSNIIADWSYGNKSGMSIDGNKYYSRRDWSRVLCFAKKINDENKKV